MDDSKECSTASDQSSLHGNNFKEQFCVEMLSALIDFAWAASHLISSLTIDGQCHVMAARSPGFSFPLC